MARFLNGLIKGSYDIVELHPYSILIDLVNQATKVKSQLKSKLSFRKPYPNASWKVDKPPRLKMLYQRPRKNKSPKKGSEIPQG
ncbi:hypothetical protein CR513_19073, partial [Mucuna pruriens]